MTYKSFQAPLPSRSTRHISPRSQASLRGALVAQLPADAHPRRIVFESKLEQHVLYLLLARPDIYDIWDQPPAVTYRSANGREKRHVFDYLVTLTSKRRVAIAVKPAELVERRQFREELHLIRAGTDLQGRAFRAVFRAIYAGVARVLDRGDISPSTRIAREVLQ